MPIKTYTLTLAKRTRLSDVVSHFAFHMGEPMMPTYVPGQFITLHIEHEGKSLKRSYSIANTTPSQQIEFAASYVPNGPASTLLFNLSEGDSVTASGPFGRLILKEEPLSRLFLVATSTGITPYRAMLETLSQKCQENPNIEVVIIQGVQYRKHILYEDAFLDFANRHPKASFYAALSRETDEALAPHEKKGYVQSVLESLAPDPKTDIIYLCGNPQMIDDTFALLKGLSFEPSAIRREKYLSR